MFAIFLRQFCNSKMTAILAFEILLLKDYREKSAPFLKYCQKIFDVANQSSEFLLN